MNYRDVEIYAPKDLGAAGTEVIDLDLQDVISELEIFWRTTVVTVSDMTNTHAACLSKIEIVDGSDVLWSLTGEQAQALSYLEGRGMPENDISVVAADYMYSSFPIRFGRYLFDEELAFNPKNYRNPQLKITWDEDAANGSVVANQLTVRGSVFDERSVSPAGFLMAKQIKSWTPVASTHEYTELPLDYPYRLIGLRLASTDKNPFETLDGFKLSEDHDKKIPYDMTGYEIFRKFQQPLQPFHQEVRLNETAADAMALYLAPTYRQSGQINFDADTIAANDDFTQITYAGNIVTIAATAEYVPYLLSLSGYAPHFCLHVPCGVLDNPATWFNPRSLGHLQLDTLGASAVGTTPEAELFIQQMRSR